MPEPIRTHHPDAPPCIAVVLPHRERFQRTGAGAVSLCVSQITRHSRHRAGTVILGEPVPEPLLAENFVPVRRASWLYGRGASRYLKGIPATLPQPPDLIEIHNRPSYIKALHRTYGRTPLLLYVHNDPRTMRGLKTPAERAWALEVLAGVVCVSEYIRGCMLEGLEGHPLAGKVRVILNGVETDVLQPGAEKRREITFIGRLSPQKGARCFAEAALRLHEALPQWRFVIIGSRNFGKTALASDYEREVAALMERLGPQGEITGYLPHAQAMARLREAAVAVMPAQWDDPCPLSVIEAMASGCAVAASPRGGIPELLGDTGVLVEGAADAGAWVEALLRLIERPKALRRYQTAARARAAAMLDVRHCAARLDRFRDELLPPGDLPGSDRRLSACGHV